jgi:hypothetical protein
LYVGKGRTNSLLSCLILLSGKRAAEPGLRVQTDIEEEKLAALFEQCKMLKRIVEYCKEEARLVVNGTPARGPSRFLMG